MFVFIDVFLFGSADVQRSMFKAQRSTLNTQHPTLNSAAASSTMTARENAAQRRGYRFLSSCFGSLAVASHPLQPDSFILGSAGRGQRPAATVSRSLVSIRG